MDIKYKLYPYPVLAEFNDSYLNVEYSVDVDIQKDGFDIVLVVKSKLTDEMLADYIATGKATYLYHVECAQTGYREIFETDKDEYKIVIKGSKLAGDVHFCPFIVAKEDIENYFNKNFNPFYSEPVSLIERGCVLAIAGQKNWDIKKNLQDLMNSSSPFRILKNMDESQKHMVVAYEGEERIMIRLTATDCGLYKAMAGDPILHDILNSAIVVPALVYVLSQLQKVDPDEIEANFGNLAWYISIKEALRKNFNKDITQIKDENVYELAQKMLKTPIGLALENLANLGGTDKGEEDK